MKQGILRRGKRWLSIALCIVAWAGAVPMAVTESADIPMADSRSQQVRVLLTRLGLTDRIDLTLDGVYGLGKAEAPTMVFPRGSRLTLWAHAGGFRLYYMGMSVEAGPRLYLTRYQGQEGQDNGLRVGDGEALYQGDLELALKDGLISPILHINVEEYLLGVVPYEMNNDFPLEALKAQAVAARTYALRKQDSGKAYDVVDTANDQVYKGYIKSYTRAAQAVQETRGVCGFYKNRLAECFYGASNGGQTELVENVWSKGDYGYYQMIDDPYDLENPLSRVKSVTIMKKFAQGEAASYGLRALLAKALEPSLVEMGFDPAPESLRVEEVLSLTVDSPAGKSPSRRMTQMHITLRYSGRTRTDAVQAIPVVDDDDQEVSLFSATPSPAATPAPTAAPQTAADSQEPAAQEATESPAPTPAPTPEPVYGPFTLVEEPAVLALEIFPDVKAALALEMNGNAPYEMVSVTEEKDRFIVEARRYGHGIGMSQRGAEWMASEYHKTYTDILDFYYPGLSLKRYPEENTPLPVLAEEWLAAPTPAPTPEPTPRPTLMPATLELPEGGWYAVVWEIAEDSSLNLRAVPDLTGDILMRLYKNQRLLVVERCPEEGWVKVRTDVAEGYVMESYLKAE